MEFPPRNSTAVLSGFYKCKIGSGNTLVQMSRYQEDGRSGDNVRSHTWARVPISIEVGLDIDARKE